MMRKQTLDFIQVDFALDNRGAAERLLPLARDRDMAVMINLPFGRGRLFDATRDRPLAGWAAEFDCSSWAQFFLKYHRRARGRHLRHSRHGPARVRARQHEGRQRAAARRSHAQAHGDRSSMPSDVPARGPSSVPSDVASDAASGVPSDAASARRADG